MGGGRLASRLFLTLLSGRRALSLSEPLRLEPQLLHDHLLLGDLSLHPHVGDGGALPARHRTVEEALADLRQRLLLLFVVFTQHVFGALGRKKPPGGGESAAVVSVCAREAVVGFVQ